MIRTLKGGVIGFPAGAVLEFIVVTGVLSGADNEDVANYSWLYALMLSPAAALVGGMIGTLIGAVMDWREGQKSPYRLFCLMMGVLVLGAGTLGIIFPFTGRSAALFNFVPGHYLETYVGIMVAGILLCLAAGLIPGCEKK
jgi:hypothetical protein